MLDMKTLLAVMILLTLMAPAIFFMVHRIGMWVGGTAQWAAGAAINCLSMLFFVLRGVAPDFVTIILANSLAAFAFGLIWCGTRIFVERKPPYKSIAAVSILLAAPMFWFSAIQPSLAVRVALMSLAIAGICIAIAFDLGRGSLAQRRPARLTCAIVYGLNAGYMLVRACLAMTLPMQEPYFQSGFIDQTLYLWSVFFYVLAMVCIVLMVSEKMQAEIKTLSGILPICAQCKKVRDDKGYWQQVERYISAHSEAEFSHGLCPDCLAASLEEIRQFSETQDKRDPARRD